MTTHRLRYSDESTEAPSIHVHTWQREKMGPMVISISSGPKDCISNRIRLLFEADVDAYAVSLFVHRGTPFLLRHVAHQLYDCSGRRVLCEPPLPGIETARVESTRHAVGGGLPCDLRPTYGPTPKSQAGL